MVNWAEEDTSGSTSRSGHRLPPPRTQEAFLLAPRSDQGCEVAALGRIRQIAENQSSRGGLLLPCLSFAVCGLIFAHEIALPILAVNLFLLGFLAWKITHQDRLYPILESPQSPL
jgi:hypothetical protein